MQCLNKPYIYRCTSIYSTLKHEMLDLDLSITNVRGVFKKFVNCLYEIKTP